MYVRTMNLRIYKFYLILTCVHLDIQRFENISIIFYNSFLSFFILKDLEQEKEEREKVKEKKKTMINKNKVLHKFLHVGFRKKSL